MSQLGPNGASSIYLGADGKWHGRVTVVIRDDRKPDRRHVEGKTQAVVTKKIRQRERDSGCVRTAGQRWTVETWLTHWIDSVATPPNLADSKHSGYRVDVEHYLIPGIGAHKLHRLEPEHLEKLYAKIIAKGKAGGTAYHVHRTIRASLNEAIRRGHLTSNPAELSEHSISDDDEIEPYDVVEIKRILKVAAERRKTARWAIALALGLRQGESIGLRWIDVDLERAVLRFRRSRLRPKYRHGCGGTCGRNPGFCRERVRINDDTKDTKARAGRRYIPLSEQIVALQHQLTQREERRTAANLWHDDGWLFARPDGRALSPNSDYREWKAILELAGVSESRLHDARHTAATMLLLLGVPARIAMQIMGWSSTSMTKRYQHVTDAMRADVADKLDGLLWDGGEGESGTN